MYIISIGPVLLNNRPSRRWLIHESNISSKETIIWFLVGKTEQSDIKKTMITERFILTYHRIYASSLSEHAPLLITKGFLVGLGIKQVVKL